MEKRIGKVCIVLLLFFFLTGGSHQVVHASESIDIEIKATDLDLGDYQKEMEVGTSQLLSITVLPLQATNQEISYESSNPDIVTVNAMGRVIAQKIGKCKITITTGTITKTIEIVVKEEQQEQDIIVTAIEVEEFKEQMKVEETQNITATVVPSDATNAGITYSSSNPAVATISSTGKITGIKKGTTTITVVAGNVKKELQLDVVVATSKIEVNTTYQVMNIGDTVEVGGKVYPKEANQSLTYKTTNSHVIEVNSSGVVTARASGSASVIISNGDMETVVTILVNQEKQSGDHQEGSQGSNSTTQPETTLLTYVKGIQGQEIHLTREQLEVVDDDLLRYLYEMDKILIIEEKEYQLTVYGKDIINFENKLYTNLELKEEHGGITFTINKGENLPGVVYLAIKEEVMQVGKYMYLYHEGRQKYELLNTKVEQGQFKIDVAGTYQITEKKQRAGQWNYIIIGILGVGISGGGIAYVWVAKKYWFW